MGDDLNQAIQCLNNLGRVEEIDDFREAVIKAHAKNWRLLQAAAESYLNNQSFGYIVAGKFYRGQQRGGGEAVNCYERDRVRALQLMVEALPLVKAEPDHAAAGEFYFAFGRLLLSNRGYQEAWRLQYLTDLGQLPDYDKGWYFGQQTERHPWTKKGRPYITRPPSRTKRRSTMASVGAGP